MSDAVEIGMGGIERVGVISVDTEVGKAVSVGKAVGISTTGVTIAICVVDGISLTDSVGILPQATKLTTNIIKKYRQGANLARRCGLALVFLYSFSMVNNVFLIVTSLRTKRLTV